MLRKYWRHALVTLIVAGLAAFAVLSNTRAAHSGAVTACNAVHDSNIATIKALRHAIAPSDSGAVTFVDNLSTTYEDVYATCLAKAP